MQIIILFSIYLFYSEPKILCAYFEAWTFVRSSHTSHTTWQALVLCMYVRILYQYFMIKSLFCECSVQKIKTHLYKNSAKKFCYKNGCIAHGNKTFLHLLDASPLWACQREVYQTLKHFHYSYKSFVGTILVVIFRVVQKLPQLLIGRKFQSALVA